MDVGAWLIISLIIILIFCLRAKRETQIDPFELKQKLSKSSPPKGWCKHITVIIKTFERPQCVLRLLSQLNQHYPDVKVIVADDSRHSIFSDKTKMGNVKWYVLPFDMGCSYGRNFMVNKVKTRYTILLDDDTSLGSKSLRRLYNYKINHPDINLVAGKIDNAYERGWCGNFAIKNNRIGKISANTLDLEIIDGGIKIDMVPNFFIADTYSLKNTPWDDNLKTSEHEDFSLRYKMNGYISAYLPSAQGSKNDSGCSSSKFYRKKRNRYSKGWWKEYMKKKYGMEFDDLSN